MHSIYQRTKRQDLQGIFQLDLFLFAQQTPHLMMHDRVWTIICSPVSGKKQGATFVKEKLVPLMKQRGILYEELYTERAGHARELASGRSNIIAVGGDGTINEVLGSAPSNCTVAVVAQGTMNFFGVCADLPATAEGIVDLIQKEQVRDAALMRVAKPGQNWSHVSFEALHIGKMPFNVCQGAQDFRFTLGPMFGIMLNLLLGNAFPTRHLTRGRLSIYPANGNPTFHVQDAFYWIIATYRNPYNGVVGNELWVSWMTMETWPGFGRMMQFFGPDQMEHFQGTSRCFGCCCKASKIEFAIDPEETVPSIPLVLDGDAVPEFGAQVTVLSDQCSWQLVASKTPPSRIDAAKIAVNGDVPYNKPITPAAQAWLNMNPPPAGVYFPMGKPADKPSEKTSLKSKLLLLVVSSLILYIARRRLA